MAEYVWQHGLIGEPERLRLMSDLLDPSSRFHLERIGVARGWHCLEVGAGNGSLSAWLAERVGAEGRVVAADIRTDPMHGLERANLKVLPFDVVRDEPADKPFDLIAVRALLHHLPQRRAVVTKLLRWLKPGGWLFVDEPDFYPTATVVPASQRELWEKFIGWAQVHEIDYFVGRKIPAWLQADGLRDITSEGHAIVYNGGSPFARWWVYGIGEVADRLEREGGLPAETLAEFFRLYADPSYWTTTIAFTATTARLPRAEAATAPPQG